MASRAALTDLAAIVSASAMMQRIDSNGSFAYQTISTAIIGGIRRSDPSNQRLILCKDILG